jgi:polyisoprenoid-binding protein YceI
MKKTIVILTAILFIVGSASAQTKKKAKKTIVKKAKVEVLAPGTSYRANKEISEVIWEGRKLTGTHYGKLKLEDGNLIVADGKILRGNVVVNMSTLTCSDIQDPNSNADLVGHLKASDFFHVEMFPHAILEIRSTKSLGENKIKVIGSLSIKGQSHPISFDAKIESLDASAVTAKGKIIFDRTKYDIKYGSSLFGAAADKAIADKVVLDVTIVANSVPKI